VSTNSNILELSIVDRFTILVQLKDTTMRLLSPDAPLAREEALAMIHELKTWPLLDGFRGRPRADVNALVDAIVSFSRMAMQLGDRIVEAEINPACVPLMVSPCSRQKRLMSYQTRGRSHSRWPRPARHSRDSRPTGRTGRPWFRQNRQSGLPPSSGGGRGASCTSKCGEHH